MAGNTCDVCHRDGVAGVAASPFVPMSFAYCEECLDKWADPTFVVEYIFFDVAEGNEAKLQPDFLDTQRTYSEDRYMTWREWLDLNSERILKARYET